MKLTELYKSLNDRALNEQETEEEKFKEVEVEIEIPGVEGKTKVKIKHKDADTEYEALTGVTITFIYGDEDDEVDQYTDIDFEGEEMLQDHENEGQDWVFVAEGDGMMFEVEVQVESEYENSGRIQYIDWETLSVTYDDEGEEYPEAQFTIDEQGCTEQEIAEGTCGYAPDGKVDVHNTDKMKPASSIKIISLQERFKKLANIKK